MPLPTIPDVWRVALQWSADAGVRAVNVIHIAGAVTDEGVIAGAMEAAVTANMWRCVSQDFHISQLVVTKLDGTADGVVFNTGVEAKWDGGESGQWVPTVAALVKLGTGGGGRSGRGRVFLPFVGETAMTNGLINASQRTETTDAWTAFLTSLLGYVTPVELCVASYTHSTWRPVIAVGCEGPIATQRRRLKR